MTGEVLYRMHGRFMIESGAWGKAPTWDSLDESERSAWNRLAGWVEGTEI